MNYGNGKSRILDPGQWLVAIDQLALDLSSRGHPLNEYTLGMLVGAHDELHKFLPETMDRIDPASVSSRSGWAKLVDAPERFTRATMETERDALSRLSP